MHANIQGTRGVRTRLANRVAPVTLLCCFCSHSTRAGAQYVGVDLYTLSAPSGFRNVAINHLGTSVVGGQVAGWAAQINAVGSHAVLWNGNGEPVDLHPTNLPGFSYSVLAATDGVHQVGGGAIGTGAGAPGHALIWSGTSDSAVDLNPTNLPGIRTSSAEGISGT